MNLPPSDRIGDALDRWNTDTPDAEAIVGAGTRLTYAALRAEVDAWAGRLLACGVEPGDRVALRGWCEPVAAVCFLATARIGATFLGLHPRYRPAELAHVLGDALPGLVVDAAPDSPLAGSPVPQVRSVAELLDQVRVGEAQVAALSARVEPGAPASLVYTSGSTGHPKGALLSQASLVRCSEVQADHWVDRSGWRTIAHHPINHVGYQGDLLVAAIVSGGCLVHLPRFEAGEVLAVLAAERVDAWYAVPAVFELATRHPAWPRTHLADLRRIQWSGGAATPELVSRLRDRGAVLSASYGSTETVGSVTYTDDDAPDEVLVESIGRPDASYDVRIDPSTGELQVRGDCVFQGYLGQPAATRAAIDAGGWLHTGDLATTRADGNLVLTGRASEQYKSGGYTVFPREVELALLAHPAVTEAAVVDVADPLWGRVGHAFVVLADEATDPHDITAKARDLLSAHKVPKRLTVLDRLPKLDIGKVDKAALRRRAEEGGP